MSVLLAFFQVLLLLPSVPLLMLSRRTPRARRSRHGQYVAAASLLAIGAGVGAIVSLALLLGGEEHGDVLLCFGVPLLTCAAAAAVIHRGTSRPAGRGRPA